MYVLDILIDDFHNKPLLSKKVLKKKPLMIIFFYRFNFLKYFIDTRIVLIFINYNAF